MTYDVITIGSVMLDVFLKCQNPIMIDSDQFSSGQGICFGRGSKFEIDELHFFAGGSALNKAVTFTQLGLKVAIISKVGDDLIGKHLLTELEHHKISTKLIAVDPKATTAYANLLIGPQGEKTALVYRGASAKLQAADLQLTKLKAKWLTITSLGGRLDLIERISQRAQQKKIKVAFNPGQGELERGLQTLMPILRHVDVLLLNREEALLLAGLAPDADIHGVFNAISIATPGSIVITDGAAGACARTQITEQEETYFVSALPNITVADATGAGDAFGAGLLTGLLLKDDLTYALRLATLNASSVIQVMGATHGLLKRVPSDAHLDKIKIRKL